MLRTSSAISSYTTRVRRITVKCFEVIQRVSRLEALSKRKKILNFVDDMEADVAKLRYVITKPISVVFYSV